MNSIRGNLLKILLLGMVLIASGTGVAVYRHEQGELDELYNAHLRQMAKLLAREWDRAEPTALTPPPTRAAAKRRWEEEDYLIQLWRHNGTLITQEIPAVTNARIPLSTAPGFHREHIDGEAWRIYRADGVHAIVQIAQPESARRDTLNETSVQLLVPLLLQVPLLILLTWFGVQRGLKPLDRLSRAIAQRQPRALTAIDGTGQPRELQPLVTTLNDLLARLDTALQQQRNFVADAAHELRTPIAALQLQIDLLQRAADADERGHAIAQLRNGLQRATHLTQQLLSIARAESDAAKPEYENVDSAALIEAVAERQLPLARARQQDLGVTHLDTISLRCARTDIETVLDNLVNNAIRYTQHGGRVDLAVYHRPPFAVFEVSDSGPGIPAAERGRIFDRFYRVLNKHPDSIVEGSGLGLAIVRTICERNGATIEISDGDDGHGARFTVYWPLSG